MKKDTRQKILEAASTLFLKGGTHALSVRAIAEGAGMSTIGIYSHFKGKQGILDALYIEGFTLVDEMMKKSEGNTPSDRLLNACEHVLRFSEAHAAHYNLIFGSNLKDYTPSEDAIAAGEKAFITLTKVVSAIIKKEIAVEERQDIAMQIWALCHGYISLNQHEIRNRINWVDWQARALNAIRLHVYALVATHNSHL
ncbi:TetR/AcrR family transcriptional regulator [Alteromonas stellipolaris]|uniref:TetR family transcriptional regulator n=1 Tax=Alteromonas stellipolaris TaxID=233316 RepID=A0ABM5YF68_9ALTE|nr:TetR/AcrR family transcriptional regulator [Alteromonas stellipolaris]ALM92091.1 Transcriptional regulator, TetR [Alteromonas stellipolaris LMG 21856]AMJ73092.1 TetR family transcriptional regulator [Alteromonas stellipolaris]